MEYFKGICYAVRYRNILLHQARQLFSHNQHFNSSLIVSPCRGIHVSPSLSGKTAGLFDARDKDHKEKEKKLIISQGSFFDKTAKNTRNKETFKVAVATYLKKEGVYRRGHVEFIYAALDRMKEFNVARDIDGYKYLIELFPKRKMIATNIWQSEMMHYPKQQQCCIDVLNQMEYNGESSNYLAEMYTSLKWQFR